MLFFHENGNMDETKARVQRNRERTGESVRIAELAKVRAYQEVSVCSMRLSQHIQTTDKGRKEGVFSSLIRFGYPRLFFFFGFFVLRVDRFHHWRHPDPSGTPVDIDQAFPGSGAS